MRKSHRSKDATPAAIPGPRVVFQCCTSEDSESLLIGLRAVLQEVLLDPTNRPTALVISVNEAVFRMIPQVGDPRNLLGRDVCFRTPQTDTVAWLDGHPVVLSPDQQVPWRIDYSPVTT